MDKTKHPIVQIGWLPIVGWLQMSVYLIFLFHILPIAVRANKVYEYDSNLCRLLENFVVFKVDSRLMFYNIYDEKML